MARLDEAIRSVSPIVTVRNTEGGIVIDYASEATAQERAAGDAVLAGFDFSPAADDEWFESKNPERKSLRDQAQIAITNHQTYLAIANPNNAQAVEQIKKLTQYQIKIIQRLIQIQ